MRTVVLVTRRERAAARLRRELDRLDGREPDPRIEAIANAKLVPKTQAALETADESTVVSYAVRDDGDDVPHPGRG